MSFCTVGNFCQTSAYTCILKDCQSFEGLQENLCYLLFSFVWYFDICPNALAGILILVDIQTYYVKTRQYRTK